MIRRIVTRVRKNYGKINITNINSDIKNEIYSEILANENLIVNHPLESCQLFKYLYLNNHNHTPFIELDTNNNNEDYMIYKLLISSICNHLNNKNGILDTKIFNNIYYLCNFFSLNNFIPKDFLTSLTKYHKNNIGIISNHHSDILKNNKPNKIISSSIALAVCGLADSKLLEKISTSIINSEWILNTCEKIQSAYILSTIYTSKSYFGDEINFFGNQNYDKNELKSPIKKLMSLNPDLMTSLNAVSLLLIFAHLEYKTGMLDIICQILLDRAKNLSLWNVINTIDSLYKLDCRFTNLLTKLSNICIDNIQVIPVDVLAKTAIQLYELGESERLLIPQISLKMDEIISKCDFDILNKLKIIFNDYGINNIILENYIKKI